MPLAYWKMLGFHPKEILVRWLMFYIKQDSAMLDSKTCCVHPAVSLFYLVSNTNQQLEVWTREKLSLLVNLFHSELCSVALH
jgi:hypothetical protein